jgi:hypothetical protein
MGRTGPGQHGRTTHFPLGDSRTFGKLVKIQEAEAQFITDYTVCATHGPEP